MDSKPGFDMQQSALYKEAMCAHDTENAIQTNQSRSGNQTNQSPNSTTKRRNKLMNRKKPCSKRLKVASQSEPSSDNYKEQ